ELEDREQLDTIDAELLQIRNFLAQAGESARMPHARCGALRETADVHFVDHKILEGKMQWCVAFPIEFFRRDAGAIGVLLRRIGADAPHLAAADRAGHGIEE